MPADTLPEQVLDTWRISSRVTLYLLDAIADEALGDVAPTKGAVWTRRSRTCTT